MTDEKLRPYHRVANIFPLLQGDEYAQLKADIAASGLHEPIWLHPDGSIIDGRNRHRACLDLGVEPRFREWGGEGSLISFVLSLNLERRHLTSSQRAVIALDVLPMLEEEARERQGHGQTAPGKTLVEIIPQASDDGKSRDHAAKVVQTNGRYVSDAKKLKEEAPDLLEQVRQGETTIPQAVKKHKKRKKQERKAAVPTQLPAAATDRFRLITSDIGSLYSHIEPGSVDWIITDPPYPKKYLTCYESLARLAAIVLKPGGGLLAMCGQSYLPEIFNLMCPHLNYHWTICYQTLGGQSAQIWPRKVNTFWKPVLWFVKSEYNGDWVGDVSRSATNDNDKRFHHWGQSESGMADLIERFTYPGQTILDPFVGGGTTGVVAVSMNRLFIGADIEQSAIDQTAARLYMVTNNVTSETGAHGVA